MRYVVSARARADLIEIWDYIAEQSGFDRADKINQELHEQMVRISEMPGVGHFLPFLEGGLRAWAVYSYLIIYRPTKPLEVLRVIHGARDLPAFLKGLD